MNHFQELIHTIQLTHQELAIQATKAVNMSLTLRNWCIGYYIVEYELHGSDRAAYGEKLVATLSLQLSGIPRTDKRDLNRYRLFYRLYPQIAMGIPEQVKERLAFPETHTVEIGATVSPQLLKPETLLQNLSFSHFELLITIEDASKRSFYEVECLRASWSVRELKRQINSLYYERSGFSHNPNQLSQLVIAQPIL